MINHIAIINIPNKTKRDKKVLLKICRLLAQTTIEGRDVSFMCKEIHYHPCVIYARLSDTGASWLTYGSEEIVTRYGNINQIHYRDFLKDKKISTKEFLGLNE